MRISKAAHAHLAAIGRKGGKRKTESKKAAAAKNGLLGGRPRKKRSEGTPEQIRMRLWQRNKRAKIKAGKEWRVRKRKRSKE